MTFSVTNQQHICNFHTGKRTSSYNLKAQASSQWQGWSIDRNKQNNSFTFSHFSTPNYKYGISPKRGAYVQTYEEVAWLRFFFFFFSWPELLVRRLSPSLHSIHRCISESFLALTLSALSLRFAVHIIQKELKCTERLILNQAFPSPLISFFKESLFVSKQILLKQMRVMQKYSLAAETPIIKSSDH